jgi:hypothetical protein
MRRRSLDDQASSVGTSSTANPTSLTGIPPQNGVPFPPEVILGGFFFEQGKGDITNLSKIFVMSPFRSAVPSRALPFIVTAGQEYSG